MQNHVFVAVFFAGALFSLMSCSEEPAAPPAPPAAPNHVSADVLKEHVTVLASDAFEGRDTGSPGYDLAAVYVAEQFLDIGLQPMGVEGTYFQPILFKDVRVAEGSAQVIVRGNDAPRLLQYIDDYYFILNPRVPSPALTAQLVYVGYGVTAPDYGLESYNGVDVEGKIAVILSGAPSDIPAEQKAVFSSLSRKAQDAMDAGAVALALVYTKQAEKRVPYDSRAERAGKGSKAWLMPDGTAYSALGDLKAVIRFSPEAGGLLFAGAEDSYEAVRDAESNGEVLPSFALPGSITARHLLEEKTVVSSNVIGKLPATARAVDDQPGGDQETGAAEETQSVLLIGHLDHIGRGKPADGDDIYNGALDNALGVAAIIEAASALAVLPEARKRDVYFAALTGEEYGLLGAQYLSRNLPMPIETLTSVLNIDMPMATYPMIAVHARGEVHSNLGPVAQRAAERYGLFLEPDPIPEESIFVRSDHYAFVQRGVPSVYLNVGVATPEGADYDGLEEMNALLKNHYHQPSDEVTLDIHWPSAARFADVHVEMLRELANTDETIAWTTGSFFDQPRASD